MLRPVACALVHCARSGQAWQGGFGHLTRRTSKLENGDLGYMITS